MNRRIVIEEEGGKPEPSRDDPAAPALDLQDALILTGVACGELAAAVIWWPSALILAFVFCFVFAYLIERAKSKEKPHGNR